MRNLPSLNGLKAFEVAARHGSFKAAADELSVTPAAISRMVKLLEERLGLALFERTANRLVMTPAGREYQAGLTPLFDAIVNLTAQVTKQAGTRVLTVGVGPTFATRWLIPRLNAFRKLEPDIDLRFATGGAAAPFGEDWTCGIKLGGGDWPGLQAEPLFAADLIPVCTPRLARKLKSPNNLKGVDLLRVAHALDDWPLWLDAEGIAGTTANGPVFDYYGQALQAAADGVGVAMGIRPYIDDDIAAGRLVAPFARSISKGFQWHLVYRRGQAGMPGFASFRNWIMAATDARS